MVIKNEQSWPTVTEELKNSKDLSSIILTPNTADVGLQPKLGHTRNGSNPLMQFNIPKIHITQSSNNTKAAEAARDSKHYRGTSQPYNNRPKEDTISGHRTFFKQESIPDGTLFKGFLPNTQGHYNTMQPFYSSKKRTQRGSVVTQHRNLFQ